MNRNQIWILILGMALVTYIPRAIPAVLIDKLRFGPNTEKFLRLGGTLIFEVGIGQAPAVEEILAMNGYEDIKTTIDTGEIWRVVEGTINS